ncbi:hypothetical protein BZB76_2823 [Actinomadura pelletieri DSM 43383]|uniref:Uncharacterized protein n=1 Tax=Actinomadura pelletieri DSM 43383 TaxID=1120940 RepID=A0A495QN86_9ACTN|nr:hypothetical protein [Actinomadura pelletieri]RKS74312.1 hypothetical protein BZB76_2823 [Actinomadura pelletieri DSM 43383]
MKEPPLSPVFTTAKGYLEHARRRLDTRDPQDRAIAYGLDLLAQVVSGVEKDLSTHETAEVAVVYDTLASQVADVFGMDVPDAFRALVELCDDPSARLLVTGQPEPDATRLAALRSRLVWATVTYQAPVGGRCRRTTEIVYRSREGDPRSQKVAQQFGWEDLPDRARERLVLGEVPAVRYQLYPPKPQP